MQSTSSIEAWAERVAGLAERAGSDPAISVPLATAGLMADIRMQTADTVRRDLMAGLAARIDGMVTASVGRRRELLQALGAVVETAAA